MLKTPSSLPAKKLPKQGLTHLNIATLNISRTQTPLLPKEEGNMNPPLTNPKLPIKGITEKTSKMLQTHFVDTRISIQKTKNSVNSKKGRVETQKREKRSDRESTIKGLPRTQSRSGKRSLGRSKGR